MYVNEHFNPTIERRRKRLYPILKKARRLSGFRTRIALEDDHLLFDGKPIGVNEFHLLSDEIHPRDIATERRGDVTFFFRTDSPLSNHHICDINVWSTKYNCVEQAYFHKKAQICHDDDAKGRIMSAKSPGVQKGIGEAIEENADWESSKLAIMEQICGAKFRQNLDLRDFLMKTESTYLAEDNPQDSYYGIGLSRNSPRAKSRANFKTNHLGIILMRIRDELRQ